MTTSTDTNENKTTNENSIKENSDLNKNSNHKYDSSIEHLKNCESCKTEKQKINKDYYENNKDRLLKEAKEKRDQLNNNLNEAINKKDTSILSHKDKQEAEGIPIEQIDSNQYVKQKQQDKYYFPKGLEDLFTKYTNKKRSRCLVLIGHAGTGKSEAPKVYATKNKYPHVFSSLNNDIRSTDLLGSFMLGKDQTSVFVLGDITKAIQIANTHSSKTCVLILDELNTMSNEVQKILNENLNFRAGLNVPLINKVFTLNEDSKILVIATMNYSSYAGTYPLNLELKSKFDFKTISGLPDKVVKESLEKEGIDNETIEALMLTEKQILKAFEENKLSQPIDLRGLLKFSEDYNYNKNVNKKTHEESLIEALELTLAGRYSDNKEELNFISEIIESNFHVRINP